MKVLTIRQPWAWLIVHGYKDIENRSWEPRYRGPLLIQASASARRRRDLEDARRLLGRRLSPELPERFETGGIIGIAQLTKCVARSSSKWFSGEIGWKLTEAKPLRFIPLKGRLGLFDPRPEIIRRVRRRLRLADASPRVSQWR
jgi:hypothetical protein